MAKYQVMQNIAKWRALASDILIRKSDKKVLVLGPCSVHNEEEMIEYAFKIKALIPQVEEKFFIVLRTFLEKPRTGHDWKGFVADPFLDQSQDLKTGITRSLKLLDRLIELDIPLAMEFIDPNLAPLFAPYITWAFIGARTMRSPIHRQLASWLPMPVGFKNPLDGDIQACFQAMEVANHSHKGFFSDRSLSLSYQITPGNPLVHPVLRGSHQGANHTLALDMTSPVMIDCAHGNSRKNVKMMGQIFLESLSWSLEHPSIFGFMLESYLEGGSQPLHFPLQRGLSITDPCLGCEETEALILTGYKLLSQSRTSSPSGHLGSSLSSPSSSEMWMSGV